MSTAIEPLAPAPAVGWTSTADAERVMSVYASPLVGIVQRLFERVRDTDELHAFSIGSEACDSRALVGTACNINNGGGGTSPVEARLAAIGEAVERYSAAWVPFDALRYGTHRELTRSGSHCLSPADFTPFADWQYERPGSRFVPFTPDTPLPWVESRRLADGAPVWIPAQPVYLRGDLMDRHPIAYPTSNGLAYGSTPDEALVGGILELVERDAVMLAWYRNLSLPLIDVEADPELREYFRRHVHPTGLDVSLVDLSVFSGVPVVLAVVRNREPGCAPLGLGAAASGSPVRAAVKATAEAVNTRTWAAIKLREGVLVDPRGNFEETVVDFDDHIALYSRPDLIPATAFLDSSPLRSTPASMPSLPSDSPGELRDALVDLLSGGGAPGGTAVDLYAVDVTAPDVREAGGHVIKVFSPQLQALDAGYARRYLGNRRLRERPVELGLIEPGDEGFNPLPHPFP
ncbi:hypothetical protein GCM10027160_10830 [Streptomyces calidiresistens]|uniref:YcaO domain-containing protein n=1 Tax=Streptomyces calidiresistens TaxID=1485586 RepID=A0A7W3T0Y6_9ACTN|nr:YcaO-like family protein [Streptomyces calidiresistens]MBB0228888.1 hypothetical protein [Streptomyces calidiresistens]